MSQKPKREKRPTLTIDLGRRWKRIAELLVKQGKPQGHSWSRWCMADVVRAGLELLALQYLSEQERRECGYPDKRIWGPE